MVSVVYLVRHCEAEGNINDVFQGHTDGEISPRGALQLEKLKEKCRDIPFDIIYSSPLQRAYKTAQAANYYHNVPIIKENGIIELNGGDMEGKKWNELPQLFPDTYPVWENNHTKFVAPNGESIVQVYIRMRDSILKIVGDNKGKTIGIFSHGCAIRTFLAFASGYNVDGIDKMGWVDNTGICKILFDDNLIPTIEYINDCEHINSDKDTAAYQMWWRDNE